MGDILFSVDDDGVTGIGPTAPARHDVGVFGEQVNDLALAFIAPLSADDNYNWHFVLLRARLRTRKENASASICFLVHVIVESKRNGTNRRSALVDASSVAVPVPVPTQVELGQMKHDFVAVRTRRERAIDVVEHLAARVARVKQEGLGEDRLLPVPHHAGLDHGAHFEADGAAAFDHAKARPAQDILELDHVAIHVRDVEQAAMAAGQAGQCLQAFHGRRTRAGILERGDHRRQSGVERPFDYVPLEERNGAGLVHLGVILEDLARAGEVILARCRDVRLMAGPGVIRTPARRARCG